MGIGEWFGFGSPKPAADDGPRVPTREDLLGAVDRVEQLAREARVPGLVSSRLARVARTVRETIPRLDALGTGSPQAYSVMATATSYLPDAVGGYLRLPRQWADTRPVDKGRTSLMVLVDQLDLLGSTMDRIFDAVCRSDAEALVVHGRFLEEKFGHSSTGGELALGADAQVPPQPGSPQTPPAADGGLAPLAPPARQSGWSQ